MTRIIQFALAGSLALVASCDYSGDFLFNKVDGLPEVYTIEGPSDGYLVPAALETVEDLRAATIYGEIAPPTSSLLGGATFTFLGTGGNVCIWVDPEVVAWGPAIGRNPTADGEAFTWPDNLFDDGDIDLTAGLSVYYTGSPRILGDFQVAYEDSLGNEIGLSLASCPSGVGQGGLPTIAGKGNPEFCTINTAGVEGVSHTVVLTNFSTPVDDSRLAYGLLLAEGSCEDVFSVVFGGNEGGPGGGLGGAIDPQQAECVIQGEALEPVPLTGDAEDYQPSVGFASIEDRIWPRALEFEERFCNASADNSMRQWCRQEINNLEDLSQERGEALRCMWEDMDVENYDVAERCFCGDVNDLPDAAAF